MNEQEPMGDNSPSLHINVAHSDSPPYPPPYGEIAISLCIVVAYVVLKIWANDGDTAMWGVLFGAMGSYWFGTAKKKGNSQ